MRAARLLLALPGVAAIVWGVLLLLDRPDGLVSVLVWAGGAVLVHDLVVAPLTVVVGLALGRVLPPATRAPALLLLAGWALVTVAVANVLSGQGGKPDNPTLLTGDYGLAWGVATLLVALAVGALVVVGVRQERRRTSAPS
ncbi:MAG: hypothetical protein PGN15_06090 [Aeromicrobium erythreum]